jgi:hypothetical protein
VADDKKIPAAYVAPCLTKRSLEQGRLLLLGRAWLGDVGARTLLELLYPEPEFPQPQIEEPSGE